MIQNLHKKGLTPKNIHTSMVPSYATVKRWAVEFKRGRQSFEDDANPERLVTIAFSEMVNNVNSIDTLVNVNAPVVATTSWWLHFTAPVVA